MAPFIQRVFLQPGNIAWLPTALVCVDALRHTGTIHGTAAHSLRAGEWPQAKAQLNGLLNKPCQSPSTTP